MKKTVVEKIVFNTFTVITFLVVILATFLLGYIVFRGIGKISWEFISTQPKEGMMEGGILPAILGTLVLIFGTCAIAFPIGVLSGIYMNEYAKENLFKKIIGMMNNNLAGIPSVVFGLFGLALFVNFFNFGVGILSGCLTLSILIIPVVIRTTGESLKLVDNSFRLSSYALGASKLETIFKVILPMALPNILTGLILSIGRVAGETAPIIFTVVAYYLPEIIIQWNAPVMALPYHLYVMATSGIGLEKSRDIAFGTAFVLMLIVFVLNFAAGSMKYYFKKGKLT